MFSEASFVNVDTRSTRTPMMNELSRILRGNYGRILRSDCRGFQIFRSLCETLLDGTVLVGIKEFLSLVYVDWVRIPKRMRGREHTCTKREASSVASLK
jgi:hypothetical protein